RPKANRRACISSGKRKPTSNSGSSSSACSPPRRPSEASGGSRRTQRSPHTWCAGSFLPVRPNRPWPRVACLSFPLAASLSMSRRPLPAVLLSVGAHALILLGLSFWRTEVRERPLAIETAVFADPREMHLGLAGSDEERSLDIRVVEPVQPPPAPSSSA